MSEDAESIVIDKLQTEILDLDRRSASKKRMVNELCGMANRAPLYPDIVDPNTATAVRPDEYYGKRLATAVRMILDRRKAVGLGAATVNEIFDDLVRGGFAFDAKNDSYAKRGLYQALSKNTTTFHKLPNSTYGLPEWYEIVRPRKKSVNGEEDQEEETVASETANEGNETADDSTDSEPVQAAPKPR